MKLSFIWLLRVFIKIDIKYSRRLLSCHKSCNFKDNKYNFVILKRIFYIFLFIAGFHLSSAAQVKSTFISDNSVKSIKFYPNPAVSLINFEFQKGYDKSYSLLIFNFIGKKVYELKPTDEKITVPLTDFYRGVYIYQLRDRSGKIIESGKFQVIK